MHQNVRKLIHLIIYVFVLIPSILDGQKIRLPAEWEHQEQVHMSWFGGERRDTVLCSAIQALAPTIPITLNIYEDTLRKSVINKLLSYEIDTSRVKIIHDSYVDFWTRDPLFFVYRDDSLAMTCFNYSAYGVYPDIAGEPMPDDVQLMGEYDERLAKQLNIPMIKSDFVFEGGGIETNGKGTFLLIYDMVMQRNPTKTLQDISKELIRTLGAKTIYYLHNGIIEDRIFENFGPFYKNYFGGGANMHIDELCRFVNERTVVLPYIDKKEIHQNPVDSINYFMLEENYQMLRKAFTHDGKRFRIRRVPMPDVEELVYKQLVTDKNKEQFSSFGFTVGDTILRVPAASYVNYFVSNKVVLIPKYWQPGMKESQKVKDAEALKIFSRIFPGRNVIQIFALGINRGGGGIHCMTHEQPTFLSTR